MEMEKKKNLTLRLNEEILRKAKFVALEHNMSLSKWVAQLIVSNVQADTAREVAKKRALRRLRKGWRLGGKPVAREELHER